MATYFFFVRASMMRWQELSGGVARKKQKRVEINRGVLYEASTEDVEFFEVRVPTSHTLSLSCHFFSSQFLSFSISSSVVRVPVLRMSSILSPKRIQTYGTSLASDTSIPPHFLKQLHPSVCLSYLFIYLSIPRWSVFMVGAA